MMNKTMTGWEKSGLGLSEYLTVGDEIDSSLQEYFLEVLPPIVKGGFVQIGEAYDHNRNGATYMTHYRGIYLGCINNVYKFLDEATDAVSNAVIIRKTKAA